MSVTYLTETMSVIAQNIMERTANTFCSETGNACEPENATLKAYSGLVPMSPYTTPSAASVRPAVALAPGGGELLNLYSRNCCSQTDPSTGSRASQCGVEFRLAINPCSQTYYSPCGRWFARKPIAMAAGSRANQ